jgi:hypothetical protein
VRGEEATPGARVNPRGGSVGSTEGFTREAESAKRAIVSALEDVKKAIPAAKLIEAGPDLVGLADVADMLGMSRQNMRKLMLVHAANFPAPVHAES